jgi:hypothetical protein
VLAGGCCSAWCPAAAGYLGCPILLSSRSTWWRACSPTTHMWSAEQPQLLAEEQQRCGQQMVACSCRMVWRSRSDVVCHAVPGYAAGRNAKQQSCQACLGLRSVWRESLVVA